MEEQKMKISEPPTCPHCAGLMEKMDSRELDWDTPFLWVCFNDECKFFKKGWQSMMDNYGQLTSYRYMVEPDTGTCGVIPAFSHEYLSTYGKPEGSCSEPDE